MRCRTLSLTVTQVKPYSQYLPCLSYDQYRAAPNNFLAPLSVDEVMAACFSPP